MNIRFYNARILTMESRELIKGELWTSDDRISFIGTPSEEEISKESFDRQIDCEGNVLMPGFKNAHAHSAMTFSRSVADSYELNDWLYKAIFPMEAKLNDSYTYTFSKLAFAEYIKSGITADFDMYFHLDGIVKASNEVGMRTVICSSANDFGGIDRLEDEYLKYNDAGELIGYKLGIHAEYTTSKENIAKAVEVAHKYRAPMFTHISETKSENLGCIERYGMTPVELFDKMGFYDYGGGGFHCVWFNENDRRIFSEKGLYAVFNAASNLKLASGVPDVSSFIGDGVSFGIGTDGAGSNNSLNMFKEMFLCATQSNILREKSYSVDPFDILKAACCTGAKIMGLDDCDILAKGKKADIIMIDMKDPSMQPESVFVDNLVFSGDTSVVKMTMINGKILYENGSFTTVDIDSLYEEARIKAGEIRA